ncbi:pyridoxal-phosphate dependent enzyme [Thermococcus stetteri]|uniref:pyridoxal-phosphate dependent enzyme n=1 Tax=Thermococcus stetteri TaxID=49900 RepID=UPI001AE4557F|nr:PLP-dependent cysteine synthase family protein [Thermococcus stetteri]MBP1911722.1 cysteine synthase A [Thermococcus stetteri]
MYFAKLEFFNPFSRSIKDRAVFNLVMNALKRGDIDGTRRLFEATSGNVGISMAAISNIFDVEFRAYLPKPTPDATLTLLKVLGAEVVKTDFEVIDREMIEFVRDEAGKAGAVNLNQFENDDNFEAHYRYTAREIDEQLRSIGESPDVIIAGVGTSGHIAGIAKYFKERYDTKVIGVVPARGEKIPGIKRLETRPKWFFDAGIDEVVEATQREAIEGSIQVARREGILIGLSSGAVVSALEKTRDRYPGTAILIFPDDAFKYVEVFEKYLREG